MTSSDDRIELIKSCHVPQVPTTDRELTRDDFEEYLTSLDDKIDALESYEWSAVSLKCMAQVMVLIGQHSEVSAWTSEKSRRVTSTAFHLITESNPGLLTRMNCSLAKNVLKELQNKLLKSNFKRNPACVLCFTWLMHQIQCLELIEIFNPSVTTSLILVDDFESHNQITGLKCLTHILSHTTKSHLTIFNHDCVIMDAIKPLFYHSEPEVVPHLLECFVTLLATVQSGYYTDTKRIKMDDLVDVTLNNMFLETRPHVKATYAQYTPKLIEARGLGSVLHLSKVFDILTDLCVQTDYMLLGFEALETVIKTCWMRQRTVFDRSARVILKVSALLNRTNDPQLLARDRRQVLCLRLQSLGRLMTTLWPRDIELLTKEINSRTGLGYLLTGIFPVETMKVEKV